VRGSVGSVVVLAFVVQEQRVRFVVEVERQGSNVRLPEPSKSVWGELNRTRAGSTASSGQYGLEQAIRPRAGSLSNEQRHVTQASCPGVELRLDAASRACATKWAKLQGRGGPCSTSIWASAGYTCPARAVSGRWGVPKLQNRRLASLLVLPDQVVHAVLEVKFSFLQPGFFELLFLGGKFVVGEFFKPVIETGMLISESPVFVAGSHQLRDDILFHGMSHGCLPPAFADLRTRGGDMRERDQGV
jgi:hypothetical protein